MAIARFRPTLTWREAAGFVRAALPGRAPAPGEFERRFGEHVLDGRAVTLAPSGRVALYWILAAMDLQPGDEVITQAFNFPAVPAAIQASGATPRFVDVAPDSFELDPRKVADRIGPRTRALLVTHLYGMPADLHALGEICAERGVTLLEDCGQAVGARLGDRHLGTFGLATLFTFGPTKNFTVLGGGAVGSGTREHADRVAELAARHPRVGRRKTLKLAWDALFMSAATHPLTFDAAVFPVIRVGARFGVDPVESANTEAVEPLVGVERMPVPSGPMKGVGMTQLGRLDELNETRARNGWYLRSRLEELDGFTLPPARDGGVFLSFPILHPDRDTLAAGLRRRGVDSTSGFMMDCSTLPLFEHDGGPCPETGRALREILHLPIHPYLRHADLDRIADALASALRDA